MPGSPTTPFAVVEQIHKLLSEGMSQVEVAKHLGISRSTVKRRVALEARSKFHEARIRALANRKQLPLEKTAQTPDRRRTESPSDARSAPRTGATSSDAQTDAADDSVRELSAVDQNCIRSVAELLAAHNIAPDDVVILDQFHNAWTAQSKEGHLVQMHQVKVRVATKAEAMYRPAHIVRFSGLSVRPEVRRATAAFVPDTQVGFVWDKRHRTLEPLHDRRAMDAAWQMVAAAQPEFIFLLGDMLDLAPVSTKYVSAPTYSQTTQPSIDEMYWWLARLRAENPEARIVYQTGNHESRIGKAQMERTPELHGMSQAGGREPVLGIRHLLRLAELDIQPVEVYGDGTWLWRGEADTPVLVHHGDVVGGSNNGTAKKVAQRGRYHSVFGHVHRNESYSSTVHGPDGVYHVHTLSPGCLCRVDGLVPGVTRSPDWQQGVGFATLVGATVHPELVAIQDGTAVRGGTVYLGQDRAHDVARDMDWPQMAKAV